jgi:hypothetical protein
MVNVKSLVGLGGRRERWTNGEAYWLSAVAWMSGFLMGVAVVAVVQRYGLM